MRENAKKLLAIVISVGILATSNMPTMAQSVQNNNIAEKKTKIGMEKVSGEIIKESLSEEEKISAQNLELNSKELVDISEEGAYKVFVFTPQEDGEYCFFSIAGDNVNNYDNFSCDSIAALYSNSGEYLAEGDDEHYDVQFLIRYELLAGQKYYLSTSLYDEDATGCFEVVVITGQKYDEGIAFENNMECAIPEQYGVVGSSVTFSPVFDTGIDESHLSYKWRGYGYELDNGVENTVEYDFSTACNERSFTFTVEEEMFGELDRFLVELEIKDFWGRTYLYSTYLWQLDGWTIVGKNEKENIKVSYGSSEELSVEVISGNTIPQSYVWYQFLSESDLDDYLDVNNDERSEISKIQVSDNENCVIPEITEKQIYCVEVSDGEKIFLKGFVIQPGTNLTLDEDSQQEITIYLNEENNDMTCLAPQYTIERGEALSFSWYYNDNEEIIADTETLNVQARTQNEGIYKCTITDRYGYSVSVSYNVTVDTGLDCHFSDDIRHAFPGQMITHEVTEVYVDRGNVTYCWKNHEGDEIGNQKSITVPADSTVYYCTVEDEFGKYTVRRFECRLLENKGRLTKTTFTHMPDKAHEYMAYSFVADTTAMYTFYTNDDRAKEGGALDPEFILLNENMMMINSDDDGGREYNAKLSEELIKGTTYYLVVNSREADKIPYMVYVTGGGLVVPATPAPITPSVTPVVTPTITPIITPSNQSKVESAEGTVVSTTAAGTATLQVATNAKSITIGKVNVGGVEYNVTSIGAGAFKQSKNLKTLTLTNPNIKINKKAFKGCKNVKKIKVKVYYKTSKEQAKIKKALVKAGIKAANIKFKKMK